MWPPPTVADWRMPHRAPAALNPRRKQDPLNPAPVRIVVVDREEITASWIEHIIRAEYDVVLKSFTFSQAAWEELERTSPDMLIVDGVMPYISGEQIVRALMGRKATYPILVVSGFLSGDVVRGWFPDAPNVAFLRKPFTAQQLVDEVEKHFEPASSSMRFNLRPPVRPDS